METSAALARVQAALEAIAMDGLDDDRYPVTNDLLARAADALGAKLHPRYVALLRLIGGGNNNALWARATDGDLYAPHELHGRGLVAAAREWWGFGVPEDFLAIAGNGCGDVYALRRDGDTWGPQVWWLDHETGFGAQQTHQDVRDWLAEPLG